ncbi:hypothetical protein GCM10027212_10980 [Actinotalea caeni]
MSGIVATWFGRLERALSRYHRQVQLEQLLPVSGRVLELGAQDQSLPSALELRGYAHHLSLVDPSRLSSVRASGPAAERVQPLPAAFDPTRCSTDLLVVRSSALRAVWGLHGDIGARYIAVERGGSAGNSVETMLVRLTGRLAGRSRPVGRMSVAGTSFEVLEITNPRPRAPRIYYSPAWGATGLAERLADAGIRYVVLRWFETLPHVDEGEDLDILVADEDLERTRALVESEPGTEPIDLYSASGLPYSDFNDAAYYPPHLAEQILATAIVHESGFSVPASVEHLRSLAYHAVYHKGAASGLPSAGQHPPAGAADHDYAAHLERLAAANGVDLVPTLEGLDTYLASVGWRPPEDTLRRLATHNDWVRALIQDDPDETLPERAELAVFLLRERALDILGVDDFSRLLDHFGFDALLVEPLTGDAASRAARQLRGGNWGQGPFPVSGGEPAVLAVAVHHAPIPPYEWLQHRYPHLTNAETWELKDALRRRIESLVPPDERFNPVHSADSTHEAWQYLRVVLPERVPELHDEAHARAAALAPPPGLIRNLSVGRRARVDVVDGRQGPVVRKTFVPAFDRFLEREVFARRDLSRRIGAIPPLLDSGATWVESPLYDDRLPRDRRPLPLPVVREMVAVLRELHEAGYDVVDAKPDNFVLDAREGLKLVDLEFLHAYPDGPGSFVESANFGEPQADFDGDRPVGDMSYASRWLSATGMPLDLLVEGSPWQQQMHRAAWALGGLTTRAGSPPRRLLSRARPLARHARWLARERLTDWSLQRAVVSAAQTRRPG